MWIKKLWNNLFKKKYCNFSICWVFCENGEGTNEHIFWRFGKLNFTYYGKLKQPEPMLWLPEYKPVLEYKLPAYKSLYSGMLIPRNPRAIAL